MNFLRDVVGRLRNFFWILTVEPVAEHIEAIVRAEREERAEPLCRPDSVPRSREESGCSHPGSSSRQMVVCVRGALRRTPNGQASESGFGRTHAVPQKVLRNTAETLGSMNDDCECSAKLGKASLYLYQPARANCIGHRMAREAPQPQARGNRTLDGFVASQLKINLNAIEV